MDRLKAELPLGKMSWWSGQEVTGLCTKGMTESAKNIYRVQSMVFGHRLVNGGRGCYSKETTQGF